MILVKNGLLYVLITAVLFTTHEPVTKLFASEVNPYAITAIRFLIGSLVLLPFSVREIIKRDIKLKFKDYLIMGLLGCLFICVSMPVLQVGVMIADSPALIAIIFSSNSIITILLSSLFLGEKLTNTKKIGVAVCVIGVLFSVDFTQGSNLLSVVMATCSAVTFSIYTVLCKKYMTRVSGVIQAGISFFIASVILTTVLLVIGIDLTSGVSENIVGLLYIAVAVTGIGYWLYFSAIKVGGPQMAAITFFIKPILIPVATYLINGIVPTWNTIVAIILVFVGVILASGALLKK